MKEIEAKGILNYCGAGDGWFGFDYVMNLYNGCCHKCIYCDSRSSCYNIENFNEVRVKKDALKILEKELSKKRVKGRVIGTGAACDHYNPFESNMEITRGALSLIDKYGFGTVIVTKSNLVVRDIDILKRIAKHSPVAVIFTTTTADEALCKIIEPGAPTTSARFQAMKELADARITTGAMLTPLLPFINDTEENVVKLIEMAAEAGAKFAFSYGFGVTLRDLQRDYFYDQLDKSFPNLKHRYIEVFGNSYSCHSPNSGALWKAFASRCKELNMAIDMKEIIKNVKQKKAEQLSFL